MTTRSAKKAEPDIALLNSRDRLILAQAVHEHGADWAGIAKIISKHPLVAQAHPKSFFTAQSCQSMYFNLRKEANVQRTEDDGTANTSDNLELVKIFHTSHFNQLRALILAEEENFKAVVRDIELIRSGKWPLVTDKGEEEVSDVDEDEEELPATKSPSSFVEETPEMEEIKPPTPIKVEEQEPESKAAGDQEADDSSDDEPLHTTRRTTRRRTSTATKEDKVKVKASASATDGGDAEIEDPASGADAAGLQSPPPEVLGPARRSKRKASVLDAHESARDKKRPREVSESANDDDSASAAARARRKADPEVKRFQSIIVPLHSTISTLKDGNIFQSPIKASEAPDYHDLVKRPVDLRTIKARVKDGIITNSLEYRRDIYLMFANAIMYNRPGSSVYRMAENMRHESDQLINDFRNTEAALLHRMT